MGEMVDEADDMAMRILGDVSSREQMSRGQHQRWMEAHGNSTAVTRMGSPQPQLYMAKGDERHAPRVSESDTTPTHPCGLMWFSND
jgi:hypothetical protein